MNNQDGLRPDTITVNLMKGTEVVATQEVGAAQNWTYVFENLAEFENGEAIVYHIEEVAVPGYDAVTTGYNLTNKHVPSTIRIEGSKTWDDVNNQDGLRPDTITVNLMKGTEVVATQEVGAAQNWTYVFENLAEFENGEAIVYHIEEVAVPGYDTVTTGYNLTNKHVPSTIRIEGSKTWDDVNNQDGLRPDTITVNLMKGTEVVATQEVGAEQNWTYVFENLAEFENGEAIVYHIEEVAVPGYETIVSGYNLINKRTSELPKTGVSDNHFGTSLLVSGILILIINFKRKGFCDTVK